MSLPDPPESNVVAVLHRRSGHWACVAGQPGTGEAIRILELAQLATDDEIQPWLERVNASSTRVVLPSSEVICRTCTLPDGDEDTLDETLRLQAETQLLGTAPTHRMATAALPSSGSDAVRTGLILAWPESSPFDGPPLETTPLYVPDVAGLASLLDGRRPAEPVVWIDPDHDSLSIALTHMQGIQVRALREDLKAGDTSRSVSKAVAETAIQADLPLERIEQLAEETAASISDSSARLLLPDVVLDSALSRLELPQPIDEIDLNEYGIAMGCLLATGDELAPMTLFRRDLPQIQPTIMEATTEQLSSTRIATWLLVASILVLLLAPVAISGARLGLLKIAHPSLEDRVQDYERQVKQHRMYRALGNDAWPMTKLLADISNCTPVGIELEQIRLGQGEPVKLSGKATHPVNGQDARQLIAEMKELMEASGVFNDVVIRYEAQDTFGPRDFTIDAQVSQPLYRPPYSEDADFGIRTLAHRIYGDEAMAQGAMVAEAGSGSTTTRETPAQSAPQGNSNRIPPPPASTTPPASTVDTRAGRPSDTTTSTPARNTTTRRRSGSSSGGGASRADADNRGGNSGATRTGRIPEKLNQQQIDAMSDGEIRQQLVEVSQARKLARSDEELEKQLDEQFQMLMNELKARAKNNK